MKKVSKTGIQFEISTQQKNIKVVWDADSQPPEGGWEKSAVGAVDAERPPPVWLKALESNEFSMFDRHRFSFTPNGGTESPGNVTFQMHFCEDESSSLVTTKDLLFLTVQEDPVTSKIVSIHTGVRSDMSFASIEDGILFSSRLFSVSPFHERDSGEILSDHFQTFVKDIQKEDGGTLYDLVDRAFFESKDGFGLKKIKADRQLVLVENPLEELAEKMKKGRILLFIHGIFSNIEDCFKELLWASALHGAYPGGLYGFDHPTVSASTLDNALELARMLPAGSEFDIVCHSRGGLVTRYLLEHTEVKILLNENITFRRVAFVAGACKGSPYATKEFLNAFLLAATAFGLLTSTERLIAGIVELAKFANEAPGILCLDPDLISNDQELVKEAQPDPQCMFFRANFDPVNWLYNCAEEILVDCTVFHGAGNDLVVSFWGADMSDNYPSTEPVEGQVFGDEETEQSYVHHLSFFDCDKVLENIINFLLN